MQSLGILGTGELTEKVVRGLRRSGFEGTIHLSPRNRQRATSLAGECRCLLAANNQAVVDSADYLIVGVRPEALPRLAAEVSLKPHQQLISLVAGVDLATLAEHFGTAHHTRAMLSYATQINQSMVVVCPAQADVERLLAPLGSLVTLQREEDFELATVAACMNGWFYFLLHDLQQWLMEKGLPADTARALVLGNLQDCLASAGHQPEHSLSELGQRIATSGTYTANGLDVLNHQQASAPWNAACQVVLDALLTHRAN